MLLKADGGRVHHIPEDKTNWLFQVMSVDGEIGLIVAYDLKTKEPIDLAEPLERCIFVEPREFLNLLEELEALRDYIKYPDNDTEIEAEKEIWEEGYREGMNAAIKLVAMRASPPSSSP